MKKLLSVVLASTMLLALLVAIAPAFDEKADADSINLLDVTASDLYGNAFSGSIFGEYDLTLLNIWATWCGPCLGEMPSLQQAYEVLEPRGINIVGLLFDEDNISGALCAYDEKGITYTTILAGTNEKLQAVKSVTAIPVTCYVNRDGFVCDKYTHVGAQSYGKWIDSITAVMLEEYGIELTDLPELPDPTTTPKPSPTAKPGDDSSYTFDEATGTLTVSGKATGDYGCDNRAEATLAPWYGIAGIKHIVVSEGMVYIGSYAFQSIAGVESLSLPSTLSHIAQDAFYALAVPEIVIPEGVVTMESQALKATTLSLPSTLVNIPQTFFLSQLCTSLTSVTVSPKNKILCSVDGVLYSKNKQVLMHYPMRKDGTEYTTLPETQVIGNYAIGKSARLKKLCITDKVTMLNPYAIYSMSLLKELYFYGDCPTTTFDTSIDACPRLATIFYAEGKTGWENTFLGKPTASFKPVTTLLGDVNGDAAVTQTDALLLLRTLAGWTTTIDTAAADINGDTFVTQSDALLLLRHLAGWTVAQFTA